MNEASSTFTQWGGWIIGALTLLVTFLANRRKGQIDESALVLGKWKELVDQHQLAIKDIREEFAEYKRSAMAEIGELRDRLSKAEHRIVELELENAGLKRAIAQNSQSTAQMLGDAITGQGGRIREQPE